jgi:hypothetical protein
MCAYYPHQRKFTEPQIMFYVYTAMLCTAFIAFTALEKAILEHVLFVAVFTLSRAVRQSC